MMFYYNVPGIRCDVKDILSKFDVISTSFYVYVFNAKGNSIYHVYLIYKKKIMNFAKMK